MSLKYETEEEQEGTLPNLSLQDVQSRITKDKPQSVETSKLPTPPPSPVMNPNPPSKKRRRSDATSKIKGEYDDENNDENNDTTQTPITDPKAKHATKKQPPIKSETGKPSTTTTKNSKRGRPAGGSRSFTPEQDAYLVLLRQTVKKESEVYEKFEAKFKTEKKPKALKNRWFAIKDAVLLSGEEEQVLVETIRETMGDMAAAIVEKFKAKTGTKVTKAYVQKKIKEFDAKGGANTVKDEGAVKREGDVKDEE
ncbi:hypothetical protein ABW20_dc0109588 [Dactylellina cionopaga]|nr:hypothetical protein ABW20_dc0109588 [Dactylellina cionopaga]